MRRTITISLLSIFTLIALIALGCKQDGGEVTQGTAPENEASVESAPEAQDQNPTVVIELGERGYACK